MMEKRVGIQGVLQASLLTRTQLDKLISLGIVRVEQTPEPGRPRTFDMTETIRITALAELLRLGVSREIAKQATWHLHGLKDGPAILAVWQGPMRRIIPHSERGTRPPPKERHGYYYNPDMPPFDWDIVSPQRASELRDHPDTYSMATVNLDNVEARVRKVFESDAASDD